MNYKVTVNGKELVARLIARSNSSISFEVAGERYDVSLEPHPTSIAPAPAAAPVPSALPQAPAGALIGASPGEVRAPMPGIIVKVAASAGMHVSRGTQLLGMEAMKMENPILAPTNGTVTEILVKEGDEVENGRLLVRIAPDQARS